MSTHFLFHSQTFHNDGGDTLFNHTVCTIRDSLDGVCWKLYKVLATHDQSMYLILIIHKYDHGDVIGPVWMLLRDSHNPVLSELPRLLLRKAP